MILVVQLPGWTVRFDVAPVEHYQVPNLILQRLAVLEVRIGFFVLSYSQEAYLDYGGVDFFDRFPFAVHPMAACCKLSFAIRPGLSQEDRRRPKEMTKERQEGNTLHSHSSSADARKVGVGRNRGSLTSAPSLSVSASLSSSRSLLSRTSHSDVSLYAPSSTGARASLPTSVVDRKSSTALLNLSSARRSPIGNRLLPLPISFHTSFHSTFCCSFHCPWFLKTCSLVCSLHLHHQHCAEVRFSVYSKYCPVRQYLVLIW